jgi:hypothetical protein
MKCAYLEWDKCGSGYGLVESFLDHVIEPASSIRIREIP